MEHYTPSNIIRRLLAYLRLFPTLYLNIYNYLQLTFSSRVHFKNVLYISFEHTNEYLYFIWENKETIKKSEGISLRRGLEKIIAGLSLLIGLALHATHSFVLILVQIRHKHVLLIVDENCAHQARKTSFEQVRTVRRPRVRELKSEATSLSCLSVSIAHRLYCVLSQMSFASFETDAESSRNVIRADRSL